jgi:hypothetical protein
MKKLFSAAVAAAMLTTGAQAATASLDFVALEALLGEGSVEGQTFDFGGLSVKLSSTTGDNAYLDGLNTAGNPAGLGVCTNVNPSGCKPGSDDNIDSSEVLLLEFDRLVSLSSFVFRDASHNILDNKELFAYSADSGVGEEAFGGGFSTTSTFLKLTGVGKSQFYVSSIEAKFRSNQNAAPIPLPAGLPLLAGALGMLAFARRKSA